MVAEPQQRQQLDLFDADRWPKKPYCSDDLAAGVVIRSQRDAFKRPYIQANPPHLRAWSIFDVDRPGAAVAWEDAELPPPSWTATNPENGHAHLCYGLQAPVLLEAEDARQAPIRYLCAVEAAFRAELRADQGYSGLITKNPKHPLWRVLYGPRPYYDLADLAEWAELPKHLPKRGRVEEIGLGRNVTLFDFLRHGAYRSIRKAKEGGDYDAWRSLLNGRALSRNGEFLHPLDVREVWHIVKSVAKWTWSKFDLAASDARFSALQAYRGRKGGKAGMLARWGDNEDKRASARLMAAQGHGTAEIARALGVTDRTIRNWLKA